MAQKWQDFKIKELVYGKLTKNKKGSPIVYLSMLGGDLSHPRIRLNRQEAPINGGPPVVIPVVSPFGLSLFDPDSKGRSNFDITLDDPEMLQFFVALDARNVQEAIRNKETWFKAGVDDSQIASMYYPLVHRDEKHNKYPPQLRIKVNVDPGDRQVTVTKTSEDLKQYWKRTPDDLRAKFLRVFANVDLSCIWFQKTQFGMTLILSSVNILSAPKKKEMDFDWGGEPPQLAGYDSVPPPAEAEPELSVLVGAKLSAAA
jgi:hypothetical protein